MKKRIKSQLFEFTPLGKADKEVRGYLEERLDSHQVERYRRALQQYRHLKLIQASLKLLFYASIITTIAATFGFNQLNILQKLASYLGTSLIFIMFAITSYITMIRKENYHVQREILISKASLDEVKPSCLKEEIEEDMHDN